MQSMTGYGYAERLTNDFLMSVELKSYNNRYLEISHNIPFFLSRFEIPIDDHIKRITARGHVDVNIRVRQLSSDIDLHVDEEAVRRYAQAFRRIGEIAGIQTEPELKDFLGTEGIIANVKDTNVDRYEQTLMELLSQALADFIASKEREGEATRKDLKRLGEQLQADLESVRSHAASLESRLKENLISRFDELLGAKGYDENRFLQEVAILLTKYSINEELVRMETHLAEFRKLIGRDDAVGKKLDFLSQEMNREINTIGSKSVVVEVNQMVVSMKDSLENIREQVRNIE
jgi:uncharacterized protein (TIGR00255 family)